MDWWFELAMIILIPIVVVELILLIVPLPRRKKRWGERDY